MRSKKTPAPLRSTSGDAYPAGPLSPADNSPFSSAAFDQYMMGGVQNEARCGAGGAKEPTAPAGGLGKKLLSFPWTRSDKKHAAQQQQQQIVAQQTPPSPTVASPPAASSLQTTASLPMGFPAPPPPSASTKPQQHPSVAIFVPQHAQSNSSLSTFRTTSSFASTSIFASSQDGWESEATSLSLTSSPESSGRSDSGYAPRMWRVKGLKDEAMSAPRQRPLSDIVERENEDVRSSLYYDSPSGSPSPSMRGSPVRRNSTPVPHSVAAMMLAADPETPPRPKRFSTSCVKPSPTSPPFDPAYEVAMAVATRRRQQLAQQQHQQHQQLEASPARSIGGDEADDEVSPVRGGAQRRSSFGGMSSLSSARIPSIRFEGISMDAVFAEVEKNLNGETSGSPARSMGGKREKRRSRVLSMYMPLNLAAAASVEPPLPTAPAGMSTSGSSSSLAESTISLSPSMRDLLRSESVTPTFSTVEAAASSSPPAPPAAPLLPLDAPRPRPWPRRTSSRPSPLNVAAANAISAWAASPASAPLQQPAPLWSPPAQGQYTFSHTAKRRSMAPTPTKQLVSPPLAGAFPSSSGSSSPVSPPLAGAFSLSPTSASPSPAGGSGLTLGEPFNPDPSPALSTTSTFRPYDIPELLVCPPSPTQEELDQRHLQQQHLQQRRGSTTSVASTASYPAETRVTVVPDKRVIRMSTRAPSRRQDRRTYVSPPQQHAASFAPPQPVSRSASPVFAPAPAPAPVPSPPSSTASSTTPTIALSPSFPMVPYQPPSVARTDFHPALSSLSAPPSPAGSSRTAEDDSSDCEESLHNMLMRLNRPHTPPEESSALAKEQQEATAPSESSLSLTKLALELHNTAHGSRLSMLAREMSASVAPSSSSAAKENVALRPDSPAKRDRRLSKLYHFDSDDSAARYGDASTLSSSLTSSAAVPSPRQIAALKLEGGARPLSPSVTHQSVALRSLCGEQHGGRNFSSSDEEDEEDASGFDFDADHRFDFGGDGDEGGEEDLDIESEIDKTLASIVQSASQSTFSSAASTSSSFASPGSVPRRRASYQHHHAQNSSLSSFASVDAERLPRSTSASSELTESSFDSSFSGEDAGEAVVCLGERVSCTYDVGVIGMAM
ncbi:hypothetical protein JCM8097_000106 [Rhodosporidiobolus ruineniae]